MLPGVGQLLDVVHTDLYKREQYALITGRVEQVCVY